MKKRGIVYKAAEIFWIPVRKIASLLHIAIIRKKVKDKNVTLITQNCIGGVIYSMIGQEFLSPTINMFIEDTNFTKLVERLPYYMSLEPIPITDKYVDPIDSNVSYPKIGIDDIELCCLHYENCQAAIEAWNRRKQRINWDNIIVIGNSWNMHENGDLIRQLCSNDNYRTICFTYEKYDLTNCVKLEGDYWKLNARMIISPHITSYKPFSYKRYFEDYISIPNLLNFDKKCALKE